MPSFAGVTRTQTTSQVHLRSITLPALHVGQYGVVEDQTRFKVLACGRRWGKTRMCAAYCVREAMRGKRCWWVAPSYGVAVIGWREIVQLAVQIPGVEIRAGDREVLFPGAGVIQIRSAAGQTGLRGEGIDLLIIDECSFVQEGVWTEALRPALSDRKGRAILISTPKGRNWFWKLWLRGRLVKGRRSDPDWRSWRFPTLSNPYIDPQEVDEAKRNLPKRSYQQEYLALFLEDAGEVFRKVTKAASKGYELTEGLKDHEYVMGVDWGKHNDYTVLSIWDVAERAMVAMDRFNQIDYTVQLDRLATLADRFHVQTIRPEVNAMGEPLVELLQGRGYYVLPFRMTNATKKELIEQYVLAFEQETISILPDPDLVNELQAFEMKRTPSGLTTYRAPEGFHDDCVIGSALGYNGILVGRPPETGDNPLQF